jgi:hypothetical protein
LFLFLRFVENRSLGFFQGKGGDDMLKHGVVIRAAGAGQRELGRKNVYLLIDPFR